MKKEIPKELINVTHLYCYNTKIKEIPKELINLKYIDCNDTKIKEIPKELINVTHLYCYDCTNLEEIPKELVNLKNINKDSNCIYDKSWIKTKDEKKIEFIFYNYKVTS